MGSLYAHTRSLFRLFTIVDHLAITLTITPTSGHDHLGQLGIDTGHKVYIMGPTTKRQGPNGPKLSCLEA